MNELAALFAASTTGDALLELGGVLLVLAVLGRVAHRVRLPTIPLYLLAGLLMGQGSVIPLAASSGFIRIAADVGVALLLLLLGLEYTPAELRQGLTGGWPAGLVDLAANATPGFVAGLLLGWGPTAATVLAGVTYISSSGIIAKQLIDLGRIGNRETPSVLTVLVLEDLVMAAYLPLVGVLLVGSTLGEAALSVGLALFAVGVALLAATRYGTHLTRALDTGSAELLLLSILGLTLTIGGLAERLQISAAVAAFLIGVALSDRVAERSREILQPIRDVFGGLFFVFFGLQIDPRTLPPTLLPAVLLALVGAATKVGTGWWAARREGVGPRGRLRAGISLIPRGEFSIVIAGLAVASGGEARLGPLAASYVLVLAIGGSIAMRYADRAPRSRT
ncbi:MAG: cation:proton antiporter [Acidimicrobiales bacterium]|nr:cation:proton antiporter [Acidimicrobiales bacterium]